MTDDDPQVSGRAGVEPAAQVVGRVGREIGLLLAGGRDPAAQPLLGQLGPVLRGAAGPQPPRAGPDLGRDAAPRERRRGSGSRVRSEQPPAPGSETTARRWWASKAAPNTESSGSDGKNPTEPVTDRVSSAGHAGRGAGVHQGVHLVRGEQVEQGRRGHQRSAGELRGVEAGEVARLGRGGDRRAVRRRVRKGRLPREPAARCRGRAGSSAAVRAAAARASGPASRCRSRGRGSPAGAPVPSRCAASAAQLGVAGRGVGGLAQREPVGGADR